MLAAGPTYIFLWMFISNIVMNNLFVAMLTNTYQNVYDEASTVALMQVWHVWFDGPESLMSFAASRDHHGLRKCTERV